MISVRHYRGPAPKPLPMEFYQVRVSFVGYSLHRFRSAIDYPRGIDITVAAIQRLVADHFRMPVSEMWSDRRAREVARPRQIAMYLCRKHTKRSLPDIGRRFGNRDHTTVIHACRQIERLRSEDSEVAGHVDTLTISLADV